MYNTLVKPVLTYASETWVLSKADERYLVCLKEEFSDAFLKQFRIRVHGGRDITMNSISYVTSQILLNI
jgi:predicted DNA-binding protein (UPF0278 family)